VGLSCFFPIDKRLSQVLGMQDFWEENSHLVEYYQPDVSDGYSSRLEWLAVGFSMPTQARDGVKW
jgi:hypothetical protein